ncbi:hypothetical protein MUA02_19170 [Enterobacteriaceae bacterium H20N1]|uniref:Uncharacterized protein n=1 Tax=Dryocola boscaweniae TaxID=2925397 RepID=A0A9X2WCL4_9ENTR|nr:hypothetical protein [Dryocola boscaweniae]MCT4703979.1 hypothetical protein [Dryocola boscaweniae]MCT4717157.1 hypothetical protein [Dryocola boscaweniae]MCT4721147.1 hypothetical protein [Dryocola boscaweniae]
MAKHRVTRPDEIEMKRRALRQARRAIMSARPEMPPQAPPVTLYEELAIGYHIRQLAKLEQWFIAQGLPVPE